MRVVMTYPYSLAFPGGGTIGCIEIARHIRMRGTDVVLVPIGKQRDNEPMATLGEVRPARSSRFHYLLGSVSTFSEVRRALKEAPTQAIVGWLHEAALLPSLSKAPQPIFAMIAAMPSYELWLRRKTRFTPVKRLIDEFWRLRPLRQADIIFALSDFTKDELVRVVGVEAHKVVVAHWAVDDSFASIQRDRFRTIDRVFFFGSLDPIKGVFDAVAALGKVRTAGYEDWELRIAGWGDRDRLDKAIREHRIEDKVAFLGVTDREGLRKELSEAQLAILPSKAESFGLSIAEAQAAGLPVVSYRTGAIPEVVADGLTGWLVPVGDTGLLAEKICEAIENPDEAFAMGLRGRKLVYEKFSWQQTADTILESLGEALRESRSKAGRG